MVIFRQILTNFRQNFDPLAGTPKNNRWDKFWTNLGFGAFFECCKGKKVSQGKGVKVLETAVGADFAPTTGSP